MFRRLRFSLAILNFCLALFLIGSEEYYDWHEYEFWQREEQRSQRPFSPVIGTEMEQAMAIDRWPGPRMRAFHSLNLPMSILIGWYSHPLSIQANSILGPFLLRSCRHLSVRQRVVALDAILLIGVFLQWYFVGLWLECRVPFVRMLRAVTTSMAILGIVMTMVAVPSAFAAIGAIDDLLSLVVILGWLLLLVIGTLSAVFAVTRMLRTSS